MKLTEKYSYSKYRNNNQSRTSGNGRIFVSEKIKFQFNPIINLSAKFWGNVGIFLLTIITLWLLFYSPYFKIKDVIVEGNSLVPAEKIATDGVIGKNIFRFDSEAAKNRIIKTAPIIEDVEIFRGIPNAVKIVVLERAPTVVWQSGENFYLIDEKGIVDKQIASAEYSELIHVVDRKNMKVNIGSQVVGKDFINFLKQIKEKFSASTNINPTGYYVEETTFDLYTQTDANFYIKFDTTRKAEKQLEDLKNIIVAYRPNIKEYVDVRINGWAYYK